MDLLNTLPMPEGFGKQVETAQGWRFRHCATFFVGDTCPDCGKTGFIAAANEINQVETYEIGVDIAAEGADKTVETQVPTGFKLTDTPPGSTPGEEKKDADVPTPPNSAEGADQTPQTGADQTTGEQETAGEQTEDIGDAMISAAITSDKLQSTPPADENTPASGSTLTTSGEGTVPVNTENPAAGVGTITDGQVPAQGGKQTRKPKNQ